MSKRRLIGVSAGAIALAIASPAFAQTASGAAAQADAPSGAAANDRDIVVTARRVAETAHDVPAAITAIGGEQLSDLLVDDAASMIRQIPGATLVTSGPAFIGDVSIRGQGGGRISSSESATGIYRDGHYAAGGKFGGRTLTRLDLFDLQRLEVLRGPQGALYGRNAVGGSLNAIANKPGLHDANGWVSAGYDSVEALDLEGVVNVPLVEGKLAARVGGFVIDQNDGHITNITTGHIVDQNSSTGLRAALAWKPSDSVDTRLTFENYYSRTPGFGSLGYRATLYNGDPLDPGIFERVLSTEAYAHIKQRALYWDTTVATGYGDWHFNVDYKHRTGGRFDEDYDHFLGYKGVVLGGKPVTLRNNEKESFENGGAQIYLSSPQSGGRWSWVGGVDGLINKPTGVVIVDGSAPPAALRRLFRSDLSIEKLRSFAAYATLGYDITPKLNLNLELRVQNDRKRIDFDRSASNAASLTAPISFEMSRSWTKLLPTATLRYKFNDAQMIYARFATGYRPGGFNTNIPGDAPDAEKLIPYDPEYVYGGEFGWKAEFFDRAWTVNLAAYYTETRNVQSLTAASITNPQFILQNVGSNHIYGVELETRGRIDLGFGRLDLNAGLATSHGRFNKGAETLDNSGVIVDLSGNRVNRTRDLQLNLGGVLRVPMGGGVVGSIGANMRTEHGGYFEPTNDDKLPNYTTVDLTAGVTIDRVQLRFYIKNISDHVYLLQDISQNNFYSSPREYGGSIKVAF